MVTDFFTKPLQGGQFKKFRDQIMNIVERRMVLTRKPWQIRRSVLEEDDRSKNVTMKC